MDVLFPSDTAIPHKLDLGSHIGQLISSSKNWVEFRIDGTALERFPGGTGAFTRTYTNETVSAFRKNSTFMGYHNAPNTVNGTSYRYLDLTLYFTQYSCSANAAGNGIQSASVSDSAPYEGDTVTFTATLKSGATFHGWYSDAACTQLVSSNQTYTCSAADLTLYAKATIDTPSTGIYAKTNGAHREAQTAYKKINGVWVKQTDIDAVKQELQNGNYKIKSKV